MSSFFKKFWGEIRLKDSSVLVRCLVNPSPSCRRCAGMPVSRTEPKPKKRAIS